MMRTGTLAFLTGILLLIHSPSLPPVCLPYLLLPVAVYLWRLMPRLRPAWIMVCGFAWALFHAHHILAPAFSHELEGRTLTLTGQVVSLPETRADAVRFEFLVDSPVLFAGKSWPSPGKIRLSWYRDPPALVPGQFWQLTVRLKRPHGFMNPGGLDYEGWLFQHRLRATGYVINTPANHYTGVTRGNFVDRLRYRLREKINLHLDSSLRGLIVAMTLGDRSQASPAARTTMINSGTYHLLAISGLHVGLVAGFIFLVVMKLWSRTGRWAVRLPAPHLAALSALAAAASYALLAGFSIPTQRALVMFTVLMSVIFSRRHHAVSHGICAALLAVLCIDPFAVMDAGFWLSFGAIMALAWGMSCRPAHTSLWWHWGRAQYVVFVGLLPLALFWFRQYALTGIAANIVAIPWIGTLTIPLAMTGMVLVNINATSGEFFLDLAALTLKIIWPLLEWLGHWRSAILHQAAPSLWSVTAGLVGAVLLLLPAGISWRWLGILWLLPLLVPIHSSPGEGEFRFTLLDVGQGLSAVVHTRNHTLVYDTGARFGTDFNAGTAVVIPYLRHTGVTHIDTLIISHGDNDHIGGAADLLQAFPDTIVLSSIPVKYAHQPWRYCRAGQHWVWDGIDFMVLNPDGPGSASGNNRSCVLRISNGTYTILLPGDIEKETEYRLVQKLGDWLAATVLVAPHHGSKTSSSMPFIDAVHPQLVLFPAGYRNRYRFPNQDIMRRYEFRGSRSYDTGRDGAVLIRAGHSGIAVTAWRREARRFWHTVD